MFHLERPLPRSLTVAAVGTELSILLAVEKYFHPRVSVFKAYGSVDEFTIRALTVSDALVFYPDDFSHARVQGFLRRLIRTSTPQIVVVVTSDPQRFEGLNQSPASADRFIVLSEPVWPWVLFRTVHTTVVAGRSRRRKA